MTDKRHTGGAPPLSEHTQARIRKLAREGMARNAIAREVGVSAASVSKVCARSTPPILFNRASTVAATEARQIDLKAERARLAQRLVAKAHDLVDLIDAPHEVIHWTKDGDMLRGTIERPTSGDVKNYLISVGVATDKHLALIRQDSDDRDLPAVDKWLAHIMGLASGQ